MSLVDGTYEEIQNITVKNMGKITSGSSDKVIHIKAL